MAQPFAGVVAEDVAGLVGTERIHMAAKRCKDKAKFTHAAAPDWLQLRQRAGIFTAPGKLQHCIVDKRRGHRRSSIFNAVKTTISSDQRPDEWIHPMLVTIFAG
ncbi:MAG: hypothetical protein DCF16_09520 [Alphaproteobacteria bacterium]|nr:MAG: hypothetical protein DCF16_09520 [Alphaproteobacteria bacterium]